MSSQNDMQTPKNWRFALRKTFLRMRRSSAARDMRKNWDKIAAIAMLIGLAVFCLVIWDMHSATLFTWGAVWGGIVFLVLSARDSKEQIYRDTLRQYAQLNHPLGDEARKVLESE